MWAPINFLVMRRHTAARPRTAAGIAADRAEEFAPQVRPSCAEVRTDGPESGGRGPERSPAGRQRVSAVTIVLMDRSKRERVGRIRAATACTLRPGQLMSRMSRVRERRVRIPWTICLLLFALCPGCVRGPNGPALRSDIVRVNAFYRSPWLTFDSDSGGKLDGISITVYLEGSDKPKGVFGSGTIVVTMYLRRVDEGGREVLTKIHEWELPPEMAEPWQAREESWLGWGYGLRLQWDPSIEVAGRDVAFVVKYLHADGRTISTRPKVLRVPVSGTRTVEG